MKDFFWMTKKKEGRKGAKILFFLYQMHSNCKVFPSAEISPKRFKFQLIILNTIQLLKHAETK